MGRSRLAVSRAGEREVVFWDRSMIEQAQEQRLLEMLTYAYDRSALTRVVWERAGVSPTDIASTSDFFAKAPFIETSDIRSGPFAGQDPFLGLLCVGIDELTAIGATSGTTGAPQPLPQQVDDIRTRSGIRDSVISGIASGGRSLNIGSAARSGHKIDARGSGTVPIFVNGDLAQIDRVIEAARRFRPTQMSVINGNTVHAFQQYEHRHQCSLRDTFDGINVMWGGEPLSTGTRRTIEAWGMRIRQMTSFGNLCGAVECAEANGSHVWEDLALVECLDPETQQAVPDGERGELVVTALADRAAPLIRYRSGDLVRFTRQQCGCGSNHGRIWTLGRLGDRILVGRRHILPGDIWTEIESLPATSAGLFQIVRSKSSEQSLYVRVGYDPAKVSRDVEGLRSELTGRLLETLNLPCQLEMHTNDDLLATRTGMKLPRVAD
jgi:phenylacetate-CoA ligase